MFDGQVFVDPAGNELEIDGSKAALIFASLKMSGLVKDGQLTEDYYDMTPELRVEKVTEVLGNVDDSLVPHVDNVLQLVESVYDPKKSPIVSDARNKATLNLNQEKFASKQFKELWQRINTKTYYTVSFDEAKLIDRCVNSLNKSLRVSTTQIVITEGYLDATKQNTPEMKKLIGKQVNQRGDCSR